MAVVAIKANLVFRLSYFLIVGLARGNERATRLGSGPGPCGAVKPSFVARLAIELTPHNLVHRETKFQIAGRHSSDEA
jgi:hypothetical protein